MKTKFPKIMMFVATVGAAHHVAAQPLKSAMVLDTRGNSGVTPVSNAQPASTSPTDSRPAKVAPANVQSANARRTLLSVARIPVESMLYGEPETASVVLLKRDMPHTQITRSWNPRATRVQPMPRMSVHRVSHITAQNNVVSLSVPGTVLLSKTPLLSK